MRVFYEFPMPGNQRQAIAIGEVLMIDAHETPKGSRLTVIMRGPDRHERTYDYPTFEGAGLEMNLFKAAAEKKD